MYGRDFSDNYGLYDLVVDIAAMSCVGRLRLSSVEPLYIDEKLLSVFALPKVCPHLHLPFQTGDDRVLKAMNKRETVKLYRDIVRKAREIDAKMAISCDIMVGFPDETEDSFNNTVSFLNDIEPMRMHIFSFSARDNTKFFNTSGLPKDIVKARYKVLKDLSEKLALKYYNRFFRKQLYMVTEEEVDDCIVGYTENYIRVTVDKGNIPVGKILPITITNITKEFIKVEYEN